VTTTIPEEPRVDHISPRDVPENVDLAGPTGPSSPDSSRYIRSVLDRAAAIQDDLAIALLVRVRDANDSGNRMPLEDFLAQQGVDVAELEAELDAEDE
jgi:hypothetical protein